MPDIELQLQMDHMQQMLHSHYILRVWRARSMDMLAELPMTLVVHIIANFLAQGDLAVAAIVTQGALKRPVFKPLASAPAHAGLRAAVGVPLRPVQEARRAARATRGGHRAKRRP